MEVKCISEFWQSVLCAKEENGDCLFMQTEQTATSLRSELTDFMEFFHLMCYNLTHHVSGTVSVRVFRLASSSTNVTTCKLFTYKEEISYNKTN